MTEPKGATAVSHAKAHDSDTEQQGGLQGRISSGHGNSPAAWSAVGLMLIGFVVWAIGMVTGPNWVLVWIGVALVPISVALGWALGRAGFGSTPH